MIELKITIEDMGQQAEIELSRPTDKVPDSRNELMERLIAEELHPHLEATLQSVAFMVTTEARHRFNIIMKKAKQQHEQGACHAIQH